jgi:hypothetical protein
MIAYYDASTQLNLEYIHCNDPSCSGGDETTATIDTVAANTGSQPKMVLDSNGFPVISYQDVTNGDLRLAHCGNADCSSGNVVSTVDNSAASVEQELSSSRRKRLSRNYLFRRHQLRS